jgi:hypothetical protein
MEFIVRTPNPSYRGKVCGVHFHDGRAFVGEHTIDASLGWTAEEIAWKLRNDFGYEVKLVAETAPAKVSRRRRKV